MIKLNSRITYLGTETLCPINQLLIVRVNVLQKQTKTLQLEPGKQEHLTTSFQNSLLFFWSFRLLNCSQESYNLDLFNTTTVTHKQIRIMLAKYCFLLTLPNLGLCTTNIHREVSYTNIQQPQKGYCKHGINTIMPTTKGNFTHTTKDFTSNLHATIHLVRHHVCSIK